MMNSENRRILSADSLVSDPVKNVNGDKIADVKNIMIDLDTGRIAYVVVSYGGILGLGDKLFAVPWLAVRVDQEDRALIIDLNEDVLSSAPGFDKDNWPDFADLQWNRSVHTHYGVDDAWLAA